jgi:UDP-glucose:(heptosyl)LPS alpha-1,3-glucosyltransferase
MRIALITERFEPRSGGVENVGWIVAHELTRAGDEVHVVARKAAPTPKIRLHQMEVSTRWQPLRVLEFSRAAARAALRRNFDIVYSLARTAHQDVFRAGGGSHASYMERRYRGLSRVVSIASPRHRVLLAMEQRVFRDPTQRIQCNSEMVRRELQTRYALPSERLAVIRNGVDLDHFHPGNRESYGVPLRRELSAKEALVWLFTGSGFARKGLDTALRALALSEQRNTQLWIAGADRVAPWQRMAHSLGVESRVRFLGFRPDMRNLYAAADALLLPTRYDACANVCLEAAAAGIPVLTSTANGAAELFADTGLPVHDTDDANGFAHALDELSDSTLRTQLGTAARARVENLSWHAHVRSLRVLFAGFRR